MIVATDPQKNKSNTDDGASLTQKFFRGLRKWSTYESDLPDFKLSDLTDEEKEQIMINMNTQIEDINVEVLRLIKLLKVMPPSAYAMIESMYKRGGAIRGSFMDPDVKYLVRQRIVPENYLKSSFDLDLVKMRPEIYKFLKENESLWLRQ